MSKARLLVVDDNPVNLKLISDVLAFEGYSIAQATCAEQALEIIQSQPLEIVLMDVGLPGMDGLTLTRALKSDEKTKHLVIVAVTAFAMAGDKVKALEAGCDGYIPKPIDIKVLPVQVESFLTSL